MGTGNSGADGFDSSVVVNNSSAVGSHGSSTFLGRHLSNVSESSSHFEFGDSCHLRSVSSEGSKSTGSSDSVDTGTSGVHSFVFSEAEGGSFSVGEDSFSASVHADGKSSSVGSESGTVGNELSVSPGLEGTGFSDGTESGTVGSKAGLLGTFSGELGVSGASKSESSRDSLSMGESVGFDGLHSSHVSNFSQVEGTTSGSNSSSGSGSVVFHAFEVGESGSSVFFGSECESSTVSGQSSSVSLSHAEVVNTSSSEDFGFTGEVLLSTESGNSSKV